MTQSALFALPFLLISAATQASPQPVVLKTPTHVYVPKGFDTNDNVQVIVEGYLPNLCYRAPFAEVQVSGETISITMKAYVTGTLCAMAIVPYLEPVNLGALPKGNYRVVVNGGTDFPEFSSVAVKEALTPQADEHIYANLESIQKFEGSRKITLHGSNPSSCFKFDRFEVISNGKDTYSILPIMKQISQECPPVITHHFTLLFEVPKTLDAEKILLHVRTMNGKAINSVYEAE